MAPPSLRSFSLLARPTSSGSIRQRPSKFVFKSSGVTSSVFAPSTKARSLFYEEELQRYWSFALAAFGGVFTVTLFALSSNVKLDDSIKSVVAGFLIFMFILSIITVSATLVGSTSNGPSDDGDIEDGLMLIDEVGVMGGCDMDLLITAVSLALLILLIYIVDILLIIFYSFVNLSHPAIGKYFVFAAVMVDLLITPLWVYLWRRPKCWYSSSLMKCVLELCWRCLRKFREIWSGLSNSNFMITFHDWWSKSLKFILKLWHKEKFPGTGSQPYVQTLYTGSTSTEPAAFLDSISAMPAYKDRCHEELRWEDYESGNKGWGAECFDGS